MITFKKVNKNSKLPEPTPSGFDLYAPERVDLPPNSSYTIGSGIYVSIPEGYVGKIYARSQMAVKTNIRVGAQIVHHNFPGELQISLHNSGKDTIEICPNDRVAQLIVTPCLTDYKIEE